jgi:CHAD domain-containing protein
MFYCKKKTQVIELVTQVQTYKPRNRDPNIQRYTPLSKGATVLHPSEFRLPDGYDEQHFISELATSHFIKREHSNAQKFAIYDTFDWRLFNKSLALYVSESDLILHQLPHLTPLYRAKITTHPVFLADVPEGELKAELAPIIEMRALMQLAEICSESTAYRVLNSDEKTVERLFYENIRTADPTEALNVSTHLCVQPIRGYPKHYRKLTRRLVEMGCVPIEAGALYVTILEAFGKEPGDYSSKLNLQLDPEMRADEAAKVILRFLLKVIRSNEDGIRSDLDIEFLHDFRVAIRRLRSALSQIKSVFPAETTDRFRRDFSSLGRLTGALRDLDVYLSSEDAYKAMLPDSLRDDIEPLFDLLREKREKALAEVIDGLNAEPYAETLRDFETFLNQPPADSPTAPYAAVPIVDIAQKRIYKRYRKLIKTGSRILENAEDELLHELRIEGKKLRYLMEFFSSLFPDDEISTLIKQLKRLQDDLGDFNDFRVQMDYLLHLADELPRTDPQSRRTLLAVGSLIGTLNRESQTVKAAFSGSFTDFASPSTRKLCRRLFRTKKKDR